MNKSLRKSVSPGTRTMQPNKHSGVGFASVNDFDRGQNADLRTIAESMASVSYGKGDTMKQSSRDQLEESVKDPHRPPVHIRKLTDFLQEEYKKKFGIFQEDSLTLFVFWKDHVSKFYKNKRQERERQRQTLQAIEQDLMPQGNKTMQPGSAKKMRASSALKFESNKTSKWLKVHPGYKEFEECYEVDVSYTIEKDCNARRDKRKIEQLQTKSKLTSSLKEKKTEANVSAVQSMLTVYFEYKVEEALEPHVEKKLKQKEDKKYVEKQKMEIQKKKEEDKDYKANAKKAAKLKKQKEEEEKRKLRAEVLGKEYVDFSDDSDAKKDDSETDQEESSKAEIGYERDRAASEKKLKEKQKSDQKPKKPVEDKTILKMRGMPDHQAAPSAETYNESISDLKISFNKIDYENAGFIDKFKLQRFVTTASDEECIELIKLASKQKPDKVNFDEYCQAVHYRQKFKFKSGSYLISVPHWGEVFRLTKLQKEKGISRLAYLEAEADHSEVVAQRNKFKMDKEMLEQVLIPAARVGMPGNLSEVQKFFQSAKSDLPGLSEEKVNSLLRDFFSTQNKVLRLQLLKDRINASRRKGEVTLLVYYINLKADEKAANMCNLGNKDQAEAEIKRYEDDQYKKKLQAEKKQFQQESTQQYKKQAAIYKSVFGNKFDHKTGLKLENRPDYTAAKTTKFRVRENLMDLKKQFKHDIVVQNMLKEELADNQPFKYPEEYMIYDNAKEKQIKRTFAGEKEDLKVPDFEAQANMLEEFEKGDRFIRQDAHRDKKFENKKLQDLEKYLCDKAYEYHEWQIKRNKLNADPEDKQTLRNKVSKIYQDMVDKDSEHREVALKRFPFKEDLIFGKGAKKTATMAKAYPESFKNYFFKLVNAIVNLGKGKGAKMMKKPANLIMLVGARIATLQDDVNNKTKNKKLAAGVMLALVDKQKKAEKKAWRSRVFKRQDMKKKLANVFMQYSEIENCTFEPDVAPNPPGFVQEADHMEPGAFIKRMGTDFSKQNPTIYKFGKIRKAKTYLRNGDVEKCISCLCDGFDLTQVYMKFKPKEWRIWFDNKKMLEAEEAKLAEQKKLARQNTLEKRQDAIDKKKQIDKDKSLPQVEGLLTEQVKEIKKVFDQVDMKDGKPHHYIRFEDLDMAMRQFGIDPHPLEVKDAENMLKLQGKRNIDLESFMQIMAKKLIQEQSTKDLEKAFELIDNDKSGYIDVEEFTDMLKKVGADLTDLEINAMVQAADEDGSGRIEKEEFVNVMNSKQGHKSADKDDDDDLESMVHQKDKEKIAVLRDNIRRYIRKLELDLKFKRIGKHVPLLLDLFYQKKKDTLDGCKNNKELLGEKTSVYTENLDAPSYQALYEECWELVSVLFKRREEEEKRKKAIELADKSLRIKQKGFKRMNEERKNGTIPEVDKDEDDWLKQYKTIMCPLGHDCPKKTGPRWPSSALNANTKIGKECPYAHHLSELEFPETLSMRVQGNKNAAKRDINAVPVTWRKGGDLYDCQGCSRCNLCKYKQESQKIIADMTAKVINRKNTNKDKIAELVKENNEKTQTFSEKFGILKKASVLLFYNRPNEAFLQIAKAAEKIKEAQEKEDDHAKDNQKRWQMKLGLPIDSFEPPKPYEKITADDLNDKKFIKEMLDAIGQQTDESTVKLYLQYVCPQIKSAYNRETFLNNLIEEFYLKCEDMLKDKVHTIDRMGTQIGTLDEIIQLQGEDGDDDQFDDQDPPLDSKTGKPLIMPKQRKKICEHVQKKTEIEATDFKWKEHENDDGTVKKNAWYRDEFKRTKHSVDAKYERKLFYDRQTHTETSYVCPKLAKDGKFKTKTFKDNLDKVKKSLEHTLPQDKLLEPWRPSAKNFDVSKLQDPNQAKKKDKKGDDKEDEPKNKVKGILERELENLKRRPFDKE